MRIGLDLGSSSAKAIVIDGRGRTVSLERRRVGPRRRADGRVEHDAEEIWRACRAVLRRAIVAAGGGLGGRDPSARTDRPPIRLGIATQRSTVLFWDAASGRPLTPAYSWQDLRGEPQCRRLLARRGRAGGPSGAPLQETIVARTGLRLSAHYSASKLAWALAHVRGLARRVAGGGALWGGLGSYLVWRLSGGALYAIDHANAQRTLLFDLESFAWDPWLFELFGLRALVDAPALPALLPTGLGAGLPLHLEGHPLTLGAMTGDQQAALFGLRCRRRGDTIINYGSGAFVLKHSGGRPVRAHGLLTTLLWSGDGERHPGAGALYAVEGTVNAAATALAWAQHRLGLRIPVRGLDRVLGRDGDGGAARAVHFLPAVSGVAAPHWDPTARPRFVFTTPGRGAGGRLTTAGLASSRIAPSGRGRTGALLRAVIEGIACRCAEIVRAAGHLPADRARVQAAGGLTRCATLVQAQADLLQRPIEVNDAPDATALGAALLAGGAPRPANAPWGGARHRSTGGHVVKPSITPAQARRRLRDWTRAVYGGR